MSVPRYLHVTYCDDIRQELGGKMTLVGCYSSELVLDKSDVPVALPRLFAHAAAVTSVDKPFKKLVFRAYLGEELLAEMEGPTSGPSGALPHARSIGVVALMNFTPFGIVEVPCTLRIEIETEDDVIKGQALRIRGREQSEPSPFLAEVNAEQPPQ